MPITINGTSGISGADGSVGTPAFQGTDTNTGVYFPGANRLGFATDGTQRGEFDASGNFQFNSGYGSVATAYGCRAWVNFDGTSNTANLSGTYSQSGTTVTVTATAHGLIAGNVVYSDITTGTAVDGTYTVATVTDANTFTYTAGTSLTTSGNVTLRRNTIRASGNVSSITDNGTGDYTINFTTAMPDANYSTALSAEGTGAGSGPLICGPAEAGTYTTTAARIRTMSYAGVFVDSVKISAAIFR